VGNDRVVWSASYSSGGTFCPFGDASSASGACVRRVGDFLVIESSSTSYVPDTGGEPGDQPCIAVATSRARTCSISLSNEAFRC
jgi:hypothetical protein